MDRDYDLDAIKKTFNGIVHEDVFCDKCNMRPLRGLRFKCTQCEDFDLCIECFVNDNVRIGKHMPDHKMMVIARSNGNQIQECIGYARSVDVQTAPDNYVISKPAVTQPVVSNYDTSNYKSTHVPSQDCCKPYNPPVATIPPPPTTNYQTTTYQSTHVPSQDCCKPYNPPVAAIPLPPPTNYQTTTYQSTHKPSPDACLPWKPNCPKYESNYQSNYQSSNYQSTTYQSTHKPSEDICNPYYKPPVVQPPSILKPTIPPPKPVQPPVKPPVVKPPPPPPKKKSTLCTRIRSCTLCPGYRLGTPRSITYPASNAPYQSWNTTKVG